MPLGDLADWLGELPDSNNASYPLDDDGIPHLPLDDQHPYHLVVVGSQESPSSGTKLADALWDYLAAGRGKKPASPTVGSPQEVTTNATGFEASGLYEHLATSRLSGIVISVFVLKSAAKAIAGALRCPS